MYGLAESGVKNGDVGLRGSGEKFDTPSVYCPLIRDAVEPERKGVPLPKLV